MNIREKLGRLRALTEEATRCAYAGDYSEGVEYENEAEEIVDEIVELVEEATS